MPNENITNIGAGSVFDDSFSSSDGRMTWQNAVNWAASMTVGGFTDWHLPVTVFPNTGCSFRTREALGINCTLSDMGHLYYSELGNSVDSFLHTGPFKNLQDFFIGLALDMTLLQMQLTPFILVAGCKMLMDSSANLMP